jgi:hypothetical protein
MRWGKRRFQRDNYGPRRDDFEKIFVAMGAPKMMLMISTDVENEFDKIDIWIYAPEEIFAEKFAEFEPMPPFLIPKTATLLIGDHNDFAKTFAFG